MFDDASRPLFHLADKIELARIDQVHYQSYLKKVSQKQWGRTISTNAINRIFELTELHPYYFSDLCVTLWNNDTKSPPTIKNIDAAWKALIEKEEHRIRAVLQTLKAGQLNILSHLAFNPEDKPRAKIFLNKVNLAGATVTQSIENLHRQDLIYKKDKYWHILDPSIRYFLTKWI